MEIPTKIEDLLNLLENRRFKYKNEEFICLGIKKQYDRTIIYTNKHTLALVMSQVQTIEPLDNISESKLNSIVKNLNNPTEKKQIIHIKSNQEKSGDKKSGNQTQIEKFNNRFSKTTKETSVKVVPSHRPDNLQQNINIISPKLENIKTEIILEEKPFDPRTYKNHHNSPFKQEDNEWLIENAKNYTITQIAEKFNIPYPTVYVHITKNLRLKYKTKTDKAIDNQVKKKTRFTDEEIEWLKTNSEQFIMTEICEKFGISYPNVFNHLSNLKLKTKPGRKGRVVGSKKKIISKLISTIPPAKNVNDLLKNHKLKTSYETNPDQLKIGDNVQLKNVKDQGIIVGEPGKHFVNVQIVVGRKYNRGRIISYSIGQLKKIEKIEY